MVCMVSIGARRSNVSFGGTWDLNSALHLIGVLPFEPCP
jgi:hypothetical protein